MQAVEQRDYPVIQGTVVVLALAVVLVNLMTDLAYSLLDPRCQAGRMTERRTLVIESVEPVPVEALPGTLATRAPNARHAVLAQLHKKHAGGSRIVLMIGVIHRDLRPRLRDRPEQLPTRPSTRCRPTRTPWHGQPGAGHAGPATYGLRGVVIGRPLCRTARSRPRCATRTGLGYVGGKVDFVITRIADVLFAFPGLLLAILVAAIFGPAVTDQFEGPAGWRSSRARSVSSPGR